MKINIFVPTRNGGKFAGDMPHSSITGEQVIGPASPEDAIITEIDETRMHPDKVLAVRFLAFLATRRIPVSSLKMLSPEERKRLKQEFIEG